MQGGGHTDGARRGNAPEAMARGEESG